MRLPSWVQHGVVWSVVAVLFAVTLAGCAGASQEKVEQVIRIARNADIISLDPYYATAPIARQVYDNIYDELVEMTPDGKLQPSLAIEWQNVSPNEWRFKLRDGVVFHCGHKLDSQAVKFTFDRIMGFIPNIPAGRPKSLIGKILAVEATGPLEVTFKLNTTYGGFPYDLAAAWCGIVCPQCVEKYGDQYGEHPCGTGPFRFSSWVKNQECVLVANEGYWRGKPQLDKVVWKVIPEASTRLMALESGEVDLILDPPGHELPRLSSDARFKVMAAPTFRTQYLGFNVTREPWTDVRVRKAVALSLNRDEIVEVLEGRGVAPKGLFNERVFGFSSAAPLYSYNPTQAGALLDQAGWKQGPDGIRQKDGKRLQADILVSTVFPTRVAELIQQQLRRVGFEVKLNIVEEAAYLQALPRGEHNLYIWGFGIATGDADYFLWTHFHSSNKPGRRYTWYENPEVDSLLEKARESSDPKERQMLYEAVQRTIIEEAVFLPLYQENMVAVMKSQITGFELHPGEHLRMYGVSVQK